MKGLVLDLRENPGGLLNEGVDVASHFLKKGDLVVSHHGRSSPNKNYAARADGAGKDYPIVVLVNRYTASAAEIVSGALQDHDRGWILGETTFGKGLVQTVFPLNDNTGLALTTAHYYTPSGRLIQRDYSNISFLDYYTHSNLEQKNMADVKMTDSGRTVYGGGGITPDEKFELAQVQRVPDRDAPQVRVLQFLGEVLRQPRREAAQGLGAGRRRHQRVPRVPGNPEGSSSPPADFTANRDWVKQELKREMYITAFSQDESQRVAIEQDPEVLKAIDSMPKAKALVDNAKKLLVQRMTQQIPQAAAR